MVRLSQLPDEVVARVMAQDAAELKRLAHELDQLPPVHLRRPGYLEKDFAREVIYKIAALYKWESYHPYLSIHSPKGFPDWVFVKPPRIFFAELKRDTVIITPSQARWISLLRACDVEAYIWRPATPREEIAAVFAGPP